MREYQRREIGWVVMLVGALVMAGGLIRAPRIVAAESGWKAGVAATKITPRESTWMAGYASRTGPSEGTLSELYSKALVLEDPTGGRVVILTSDLIAIPRVLREAVTRQVQQRLGIPPSHVLMNCSHTHCGPVVKDDLELSVMYPLDPEQRQRVEAYFEQLVGQICEVIAQATQQLQPATLGYSHARCGFAMNRRLPGSNGFQNSPYPDGPVDHEVPVLRVESTENRLIAILFGYACHNTSTSLMQFNADYAGFAQAEIEARHPGTVALFLMGCGGDQNPYPRGDIGWAKSHGRSLANAVEAALLPTAVPVRGPLRARYEELSLAFEPVTREELLQRSNSTDKYLQRAATSLLREADQLGKVRDSYPYPIQMLQFGDDLAIVALAGEVVVDYALRIKREAGRTPTWVAGYSNDVFAYIPTERVLSEGGYEGREAMRFTSLPGAFLPGLEEAIVSTVRRLLSTPAGD